jgi:hypothetical protein
VFFLNPVNPQGDRLAADCPMRSSRFVVYFLSKKNNGIGITIMIELGDIAPKLGYKFKTKD